MFPVSRVYARKLVVVVRNADSWLVVGLEAEVGLQAPAILPGRWCRRTCREDLVLFHWARHEHCAVCSPRRGQFVFACEAVSSRCNRVLSQRALARIWSGEFGGNRPTFSVLRVPDVNLLSASSPRGRCCLLLHAVGIWNHRSCSDGIDGVGW